MKQLTGLDAQFLAMETHSVFGHVGSVCVLDPSTADEEFTLEHLTRAIESRLPLVPLFRQRLVDVPLGLDQPYWIDDPDFDIEFHVRELALPSPGTERQLTDQVARLHGRPLDRSRPLWELYLISGLPDGRLAVYNKIHHAAVDGVSGGDILSALLDLTPEGRPAPTEKAAFHGEQPPGTLSLLARSAVSAIRQPGHAARVVADLAGSPMAASLLRAPLDASLPGPLGTLARLLGGVVGGGSSEGSVLPGIPLGAPKTPFNANVTAHRRWAHTDIALADVKKVRAATGLTVNDVVMALCAGALRRWLADHDALPDEPLVSAVPVSVRTEEQKGTMGNQVSFMLAELPTQYAEPAERLKAVHAAMAVAKEQHGAIPARLMADVSEFAMPVLANRAWRLSARLRLFERVNPYNVIISNVPGPNVPLYLAGAELQAYYPVSAIFDGNGLNITVMSYRGTMFFGLVSCRELVPDLDVLAGYLKTELDEMLAALPADGASVTAVPTRAGRAKRVASKSAGSKPVKSGKPSRPGPGRRSAATS